MQLGFKAVDEQVICECFATRAGEEVKIGNIVVGAATQPEIPISGTIVSVGDNCPDHIKELIGCEIPLPSGATSNIPDPDVVFGRIEKRSTKNRIFVTMHYKGVRAVYDEKNPKSVKDETAQSRITSRIQSIN